jgi:drug/metabolite transporter (DMT)-like permease
MSPFLTILFASGATFFYMSASWIMKAWGASPYLVLVPAVMLTLAAGAWFETEIFRSSRLGHIIVLVLALEFLMTFFVAIAVLGEEYSLREIGGALVVFAGIALLSLSPTSHME